MSRRLTALKPQLNRIRAWAHEGSTDAWIAHQLETTADAVRAFRQEHGIERGGPAPLAPITPDSVVEAMLAEEEAAAVAAELAPEASAPAADSPPELEPASESAPARAPRRRTRKRAAEPAEPSEEAPEAAAPVAEEATDEAPAPARSRSRRGARGASGRAAAEPVPDAAEEQPAVDGEAAGEDEPSRSGTARKRNRRGRGRGRTRGLEARLLPGSVLLLDPAVTADPAFQEHWGDAGALRVEISAESIVLRRASADAEPDRS